MPAPSAEALQQLRQHVDSVMAAPQPAAGPQMAAQLDFCSVWPTAKPILQAVAGVIGFIPGIGTGAGPALNALISVGDQIFNATCKK
jgi:hypothetical protein